MSHGTPAKLVRDGDVEAYDDPPDEEPSVTPTMVEEEQATDGSDLIRSGDAGSGSGSGSGGSLHERLADAGQFGATWGAHIPLPGPRDDE